MKKKEQGFKRAEYKITIFARVTYDELTALETLLLSDNRIAGFSSKPNERTVEV